MTLVYILLAVIAFILWKIYRQKEQEREEMANEKLDAEYEERKKERFKDYPHLIGKLEGNWLDVFAMHHERGLPLLKLSFMLMLGESVKIDYSDGSMKWDNLWSCSEELLEHLEEFHEGTVAEHEIAVATYWQIAAEALGKLIEESPEKTISDSGRDNAPLEGHQLEVKPFTDIERIANLFPKKANHPEKEITFYDEKGGFPRESEGSTRIHEKLQAQGA